VKLQTLEVLPKSLVLIKAASLVGQDVRICHDGAAVKVSSGDCIHMLRDKTDTVQIPLGLFALVQGCKLEAFLDIVWGQVCHNRQEQLVGKDRDLRNADVSGGTARDRLRKYLVMDLWVHVGSGQFVEYLVDVGRRHRCHDCDHVAAIPLRSATGKSDKTMFRVAGVSRVAGKQ
jgi:hypothetical protein